MLAGFCLSDHLTLSTYLVYVTIANTCFLGRFYLQGIYFQRNVCVLHKLSCVISGIHINKTLHLIKTYLCQTYVQFQHFQF